MPSGRLSTYWECSRPAWSLIAERCVDRCAALGVLFRGEVFQGDGGLFAAGGLFRFHGTLCFWVYGYDLLIGLVRTPKVMRRPLRTFLVGMRSFKRMAGFALAIGGGQARDVSPESPPPIFTSYCYRSKSSLRIVIDPHGLLLLRDELIDAPPLGFFFVVRSFRVTVCFLLLTGCFVFMGL
jgi:hypothetical protein